MSFPCPTVSPALLQEVPQGCPGATYIEEVKSTRMGIWSMQTCTAMQFPISMLGMKDNLGAAKHQVSGSP